MNKKAFTLVELLAVIIILGVIAVIIVPTTEKALKDSKEKVYESQKLSLITSLKDWKLDNNDLFYDNDSVTVTLGELKEQGYVEYDVKNPKTDECISNDLQFAVTKKGKQYTYSIVGDELIDGNYTDCEAK